MARTSQKGQFVVRVRATAKLVAAAVVELSQNSLVKLEGENPHCVGGRFSHWRAGPADTPCGGSIMASKVRTIEIVVSLRRLQCRSNRLFREIPAGQKPSIARCNLGSNLLP